MWAVVKITISLEPQRSEARSLSKLLTHGLASGLPSNAFNDVGANIRTSNTGGASAILGGQ